MSRAVSGAIHGASESLVPRATGVMGEDAGSSLKELGQREHKVGGGLREWNPYARVLRCEAASEPIFACEAFQAPGGGWKLATGGKDGKLRVWCAETGKCDVIEDAHDQAISATCVVHGDTSHPTRLVTAGEDGKILLWVLEGLPAEPVAKCTHNVNIGDDNAITDCCLLPMLGDGTVRVLCATLSGKIQAVDLMNEDATLASVETPKNTAIFTISTSKASTELPQLEGWEGSEGCEQEVRVAGGGRDPQLRIWRFSADGKVAAEENQTHRHNGDVRDVVILDDGQQVLSCSGDRTTVISHIDSGSAIATFECGADVHSCQFVSRAETDDLARYGSGLVLTCSKQGAVLWDIDTTEKLMTYCDAHDRSIVANCCTMLQDNSIVALAKPDGTTTLVDLRTGPSGIRLDQTDGTPGAQNGVCKEICTFTGTDGDTMALSCSYSGVLSVWNVSKAQLVREYEVLTGEKSQLMDCGVLPTTTTGGRARLVTCGGVNQVLFYGGEDWSTLDQEWVYEGHEAIPRGVAICANGQRVISCSADKTIHVIDVTTDEQGRATGGECVQVLKGHASLVDRCCLFEDDKKLLSASWDKTAKVWDLSSGECILTLEGNGNKLRGCATFENGTRAVAVGSGSTMCVWDLDLQSSQDSIHPKVQIPTGHKSTIWGLVLQQRENFDAPLVVTYSNDRTIKCWDLTPGKEHELVGGRRALDNQPMCVATVEPAFLHGQFSILAGSVNEIWMIDQSSIHTNPSAGAVWDARTRVSHADFVRWIADSVKEFSGHWLYTRWRDDGFTFVHKLTCKDEYSDRFGPEDAVRVLKGIMEVFDTEREGLTVGEYTGDKSDKALSTIGLLSRSGNADGYCEETGCPVTALTLAILDGNEDMVSLLLDDYRLQIVVANIDLPAIQYNYRSVTELREAVLVRLFEKFPSLASEFLCNLQLLRTEDLVMRGSKCSFDSDPNSADEQLMIGQLSRDKVPSVRANWSSKWWDDRIDDIWADSGRKSSRIQTRQKDSAWGERVWSHMVPIRGTLDDRERDALLDRHAENADKRRAASRENGCRSPEQNPCRKLGYTSVADTTSDEQNEEEQFPAGGVVARSRRRESSLCGWCSKASHWDENQQPPFTRLLIAVLEADRASGGHSGVLSAHVIYHIVMYKWTPRGEKVAVMVHAMFTSYVIYVILLTGTLISFLDSHDVSLHDEPDLRAVVSHYGAWGSLAFCSIHVCLQLWHEVLQLQILGRAYFSDLFNIIDWLAGLLGLFSFVAIYLHTAFPMTVDQINLLETCASQGLLLSWVKVLYFLKGALTGASCYLHRACLLVLPSFCPCASDPNAAAGMDSTTWIVHMLFSIISNIKTFIMVLFIILFAFGASFHLLLRQSDAVVAGGDNANVSGRAGNQSAVSGLTVYDDTALAFVGVYNMMFGQFEIEDFTNAPKYPAVAIMNFVVFMLLVPTVMLNALVAFMNGMYDQLNGGQAGAILEERLSLILEFEANLRFHEGCAEYSTGWKQLYTILSLQIPCSTRHPYLHLIGPQMSATVAVTRTQHKNRRERDMQREVTRLLEQQIVLGEQIVTLQNDMKAMQKDVVTDMHRIQADMVDIKTHVEQRGSESQVSR